MKIVMDNSRMLLAHVDNRGKEIYFRGSRCYYRSVWPTLGERWHMIEGNMAFTSRHLLHVDDFDMIEELVSHRMRLLEDSKLATDEIRILKDSMPCGSYDCLALMQWHMGICVPWPIHPNVSPEALAYCPSLDVANMIRGTDVCSDEFYDNIENLIQRNSQDKNGRIYMVLD